jgi:hypothetical protein
LFFKSQKEGKFLIKCINVIIVIFVLLSWSSHFSC